MKVVISKKDIAGMNISKFLDNFELIEEDIIYADTKSDNFVIFASRHKSESKKPTLTVHTTGNFKENLYGGEENTLSFCNALIMSTALRKINELNNLPEFEVSFEATHHGPTTDFPSMFIEVGSSPKNWKNLSACKIIADTIKFIILKKEYKGESAIGFGGQHYPKLFSKMCIEEKYNFGHICPKYHINNLTKDLVKQMIEKTSPIPKIAFMDKKSLSSSEKEKVRNLCRDLIELKEV